MGASLLGLYLKLNLLLAAAFLLWLATKTLTRMLGLEVSHSQQLKIARQLFLGLLLAIPLVFLVNKLVPGLIGGIAATLPTDEFTVIAGLDASLGTDYQLGTLTIDPTLVLFALLLAGLAFQCGRLTLQIRKLKHIIGGATELKCIRGIHLLFSSMITTPFSTRALGLKQVVLPVQLLDTPRNLRLAVKHELQHVRNRDLDWVILLEAVNVLCFWNPAAWLWHNEFDCLQEFACDEVLVNERGVGSQAYGNCLLEVANASTGSALLASSNMVPKFSLWSDNRSQLKRRILMLAYVREIKHATMKSLCYVLLIGTSLINAACAVFQTGADGQNAPLVPLERVNPDFPRGAIARGFQGWVQIEFTIEASGTVSNTTVLENCVWNPGDTAENCSASDVFDEAAIAAVARWIYQPNIENGVAVKREGVQTTIRFTLEKIDEEEYRRIEEESRRRSGQ